MPQTASTMTKTFKPEDIRITVRVRFQRGTRLRIWLTRQLLHVVEWLGVLDIIEEPEATA